MKPVRELSRRGEGGDRMRRAEIMHKLKAKKLNE